MRRLAIASASILTLVFASACGAPAEGPATGAATANDGAATEAFLADYDLSGKSVAEIVETLDATNDDRETGPFGSVRPGELILTDEEREVRLPIEDAFYLSVAPYLTGTHECYNHNLTSCQGELVEQEIGVTITGADGAEIFAGPATTGPNGFAGFWLPKDTSATLTIDYAGRTATTQVSTGAEDPTCLTTMQLA